MSYEKSSGLGVYNHYGARDTGGSVGVETGKDSEMVVSIAFTGKSLNSAFFPPVKLPKGALFKEAVLRVDEAFGLGGTTPTVKFGLGDLSENYIEITEAELETAGTKVPASTGAGTFAYNSSTGVAAAALLAKGLGGTNPTSDSTKGKATLIMRFTNKGKA